MNLSAARELAKAGFASVRPLGDVLPVLEKTLTPSEYAMIQHEIAKLIHTVMSGTVDRAIAAHPELHDEIDEAIRTIGSYRCDRAVASRLPSCAEDASSRPPHHPCPVISFTNATSSSRYGLPSAWNTSWNHGSGGAPTYDFVQLSHG